jgi:hypothetical protein
MKNLPEFKIGDMVYFYEKESGERDFGVVIRLEEQVEQAVDYWLIQWCNYDDGRGLSTSTESTHIVNLYRKDYLALCGDS